MQLILMYVKHAYSQKGMVSYDVCSGGQVYKDVKTFLLNQINKTRQNTIHLHNRMF